jgi:hypothetical protein
MEPIKGKVEIDVVEFERLRDIERSVPCVYFSYNNGYNIHLVLKGENEALTEIITWYNDVMKTSEAKINSLQETIESLKKEIIEIKEKKSFIGWLFRR